MTRVLARIWNLGVLYLKIWLSVRSWRSRHAPHKIWKPPKSFLCRVSLRFIFSSIIHEASSASRFVYIRDKLLEPRGGYLLLLNMRGCTPSRLSLVTCSIIGRSFYASHVSTKMLCGESLKGCGDTKRCPSDPYVAVQKVSI